MTTSNDVKHWLSSKTVWLNTLALVALLIPALLNTDLIAKNPQLVAWLGVILTVANVALRFITTTSLTTQGDFSMRLLLIAALLSLPFAATAEAHGLPVRKHVKQVKNSDGTTTTVTLLSPVFFPRLRGDQVISVSTK